MFVKVLHGRRENDEWREVGNNSASAEAGTREDLKTSPDDQKCMLLSGHVHCSEPMTLGKAANLVNY